MTTSCARLLRLESRRRGVLLVAAVVTCVLALAGCAERRADAAPAAPPAPIAVASEKLDPPPGPLSEPQTRAELPPPQAVPDGAAPATKGPFAYEAPEVVEAPATPKPKPAPPKPAVGEPAPPVEAPVEAAAAPAPVPQLGPLISDQQRQALEREIDRNVDQAKAALNTLMGRRLTADQTEGVRRIREFIRQVEESRAHDGALARNLSERARLLAEDLVRNSR